MPARRTPPTTASAPTPDLLDIRPCRAEDIPELERLWARRGCDRRFARQVAGESTFLLACTADGIVGRGKVLWGGPTMPDVAAAHPGVPEVNGLDVIPASRGRGVGTALVRAAEAEARHRGFAEIGLGVGVDNDGAARLYRRLGYAGDLPYLDRYTWTDADGGLHDAADPCVFLTKRLAGA